MNPAEASQPDYPPRRGLPSSCSNSEEYLSLKDNEITRPVAKPIVGQTATEVSGGCCRLCHFAPPVNPATKKVSPVIFFSS